MNDLQIYQSLMGLGAVNQQQNPMTQQMNMMRQQNPSAYLAGLGNPSVRGMMQQQSPQGPSWMDSLNHMMMMQGMMPQMQQQYGMGNMGYGQGMGMMGGDQAPASWWQKGLQGTGTALQGMAPLAASAGAASLASGAGAPAAPFLLGGGIAAGGLGNLFQYLGQPGQQQQPMQRWGWAA